MLLAYRRHYNIQLWTMRWARLGSFPSSSMVLSDSTTAHRRSEGHAPID
ncbi:hypothetical protein [Paeniglutamicibacter terrestris]|uniref:Transposase n=1 Tax=Paeniglutamicibacter terrestris TaxID=2723403 RepID=A0ABX1G331_9MICC|nr:hypothetical protein [Paeniglutamicibacter terrestris]NKG20647.1 hypothetical protein [Paeniglutamicibacter terrestris]